MIKTLIGNERIGTRSGSNIYFLLTPKNEKLKYEYETNFRNMPVIVENTELLIIEA